MKRLSYLCLGALALGAAFVPPDTRAQPRRPGFGIAEIQAKLFYSNSGRFSANVIGNEKIVLWNVVVGEGNVEGPSENTLLLVRLQGPPKGYMEGLKLRVVARTENDTLLDRETEVGEMNSAGNYYQAYWLYDTGCLPVMIETRLALGRDSQLATAGIPFSCGE